MCRTPEAFASTAFERRTVCSVFVRTWFTGLVSSNSTGCCCIHPSVAKERQETLRLAHAEIVLRHPVVQEETVLPQVLLVSHRCLQNFVATTLRFAGKTAVA